jgi:hypothetical protein
MVREREDSLPYSQQPATCGYSEPIKSTQPPNQSLQYPFWSHSLLCLDLPSGLFPSDIPNKRLNTFLPSLTRATCSAHLILLDLICAMILGVSTDYESRNCAASSSLLFLHPP